MVHHLPHFAARINIPGGQEQYRSNLYLLRRDFTSFVSTSQLKMCSFCHLDGQSHLDANARHQIPDPVPDVSPFNLSVTLGDAFNTSRIARPKGDSAEPRLTWPTHFGTLKLELHGQSSQEHRNVSLTGIVKFESISATACATSATMSLSARWPLELNAGGGRYTACTSVTGHAFKLTNIEHCRTVLKTVARCQARVALLVGTSIFATKLQGVAHLQPWQCSRVELLPEASMFRVSKVHHLPHLQHESTTVILRHCRVPKNQRRA